MATEAEPLSDDLLSDRLFVTLSEAIALGRYAPGAKLSEPKLASEYSVSRATLREVIRRLEERRLVTRAPRQGVRVVIPTQEDAQELFYIREALEGLGARLAAERATDDDVRDLREMMALHRQELEKPDAMVYWQARANSDFHFLLVRIAGNKQLFDLLCGEFYPLYRLYRMKHGVVKGRAKRALVEHERIVEAIADGDGDLAELLMRRHIAAARHGLTL